MSGLSQIVGSSLGVAHIAGVNSFGEITIADDTVRSALAGTLTVADSAVASALSGTLTVADSAVASALGGTLTVADSAVASALGGTLTVADSAVASALGGTLTVADSAVASALGGTLTVADSAVASALGGTLTVADSAVLSALGGTLSVSAPTITTTSAVQKNAVSVGNTLSETTTALDLDGVKKVAVFGNLNDTSGNITVEVSLDDITYFQNDEAIIFVNAIGDFYSSIDVDARYIVFKYINNSGSSKVLTLNTSYKS